MQCTLESHFAPLIFQAIRFQKDELVKDLKKRTSWKLKVGSVKAGRQLEQGVVSGVSRLACTYIVDSLVGLRTVVSGSHEIVSRFKWRCRDVAIRIVNIRRLELRTGVYVNESVTKYLFLHRPEGRNHKKLYVLKN
ncbi:unnamed protein product [Allacma fusca]|uniref:Uncharacterized protein n=1 Tax=Allacma fusca TaxID=39272 RepID=A0A8J2KHK4_9HEXA|nr:unnamed protein product [Allacma fusca]